MNLIVVVTNDVDRNPLRIEWFENEPGYYAEDPLAWVEFHKPRDTWRGDAGRNAPRDVTLMASRILMDLSCDAEVAVSHLATHTVVSGLLEPVPGGRAA